MKIDQLAMRTKVFKEAIEKKEEVLGLKNMQGKIL